MPKLNTFGIAQLPSGPLPATVPKASLAIVSGYSVKDDNRSLLASDNATRRWVACARHMLQESWAHILRHNENVRVINIADVPAADALERQWKKLAGFIAAADTNASLVVWHDGDAMPLPRGELVQRARLIAAAQPTTDVWVPPGEVGLYKLPLMLRDDDFWGDELRKVARDVRALQGQRMHSISMHTGVMLMRGAAARQLAQQVLERFYDATEAAKGEGPLIKFMLNRSVPGDFYGGGEQGPINWYLLSQMADRTRVIPWLQRDRGLNDCGRPWIYPVRHPSIIHFSACGRTHENSLRCHAELCEDAAPAPDSAASSAASSPLAPRATRQASSPLEPRTRGPALQPARIKPPSASSGFSPGFGWLRRYDAAEATRLMGGGGSLQLRLRHQVPSWSAREFAEHCAGSDAVHANSRSRRHGSLCIALRNGTVREDAVQWTCSRLPMHHHRQWHALFANYSRSQYCVCSFSATRTDCVPTFNPHARYPGGPGSCDVFDETPRSFGSGPSGSAPWWDG